MAVTGNLKDISLTNLVQMNAQSGLTGRLSVQHAGDQSHIYFAEGEIVHAELGAISGKDAFYQMLGWEEGIFDLETDFAAPKQTITMRWSDLLLGGMQQIDESGSPVADEKQKDDVFPKDLGKLFGLERTNNSLGEGDIIMEDNMAQKMQEVLADLSGEATGLFASAVVGMDGLPVAEFAKKSVDIESFSAQMTLLIKLVDTTTKKVKAGKVEDYLLTTDKAYLLIRFLGDSDYYLGIGAVREASNLGKLRLYSRIYAERLSAVLPR